MKQADSAGSPAFSRLRADSRHPRPFEVAWAAYWDGNLFKIDLTTGACEATSFKSNQQVGKQTLHVFGMGFVFDPATGKDTLFVAGGPGVSSSPSTIASISFPNLAVSGDAILVRIDPSSGATLESYPYSSLKGGGAWAMKFWGGDFWIFLDTAVYKASRDTPKVIQTAISNTRRNGIVGAGVSTCAPVQ